MDAIGKGIFVNKRNKLLVYNSVITIFMQIVTMVCGLILPRAILSAFGSDVNGLVNSIVQFLSFITLLDGGLGGVIRAAYYKPLADNNTESISEIFATSNKFYRQIASVFVVYLFLLAFLFPVFSKEQFEYLYTFSLVLVISLVTLMQYYLGQTLKLLVFSDQHGYIHNITQIITTIVNTVLSVILINLNAGIHLVKLVAAITYLIQPIILSVYVKKHYNLDFKAKPSKYAISQRWDALARHIAFYIHSNTDIAILTVFTNFATVSVYSVYKIVVNGLTNLVAGIIGNTEATFGNMLASSDKDKFDDEFRTVDVISKIISTSCFSTCSILICRFVLIYTHGVNDADYYRPLFAIFLCASEWIYCLGLTYNNVIVSVGHFKQTTSIGIIEATINILLSIIFVFYFGITGVVVATVLAMTFKLIANVIYMRKNIYKVKLSFVFKSIISQMITVVICYCISMFLLPEISDYLGFVVVAIPTFFGSLFVSVVMNMVFCHRETIIVINRFACRLRIKKEN